VGSGAPDPGSATILVRTWGLKVAEHDDSVNDGIVIPQIVDWSRARQPGDAEQFWEIGGGYAEMPDWAKRETGVVVWLEGDHDASNSDVLRRLLRTSSNYGVGPVTIDLSQVKFMGAGTIGVIVECQNRLIAERRELVLRRPSTRVERLLIICDISYVSLTSADDVRAEFVRHGANSAGWVRRATMGDLANGSGR
jgi:anti-anti-sigma factor